MQHLRVTLQGRQELREVLHGLVVDELREARDRVQYARVKLADDRERYPQFRTDLIGRDADLLFGCDHREISVGPGVGEPLEVAFHHRPLKVRVFAELVDHDRIGLDVERLARVGVGAQRLRDRVFERLPGVGNRVRPVERFERRVHPRAGLQRADWSVQLRRKTAHMPEPVPALATLEVLQA